MVIAKILKPQGIRGELKIRPLIDNLNNFKNLKEVKIDSKSYTIESAFVRDGFVFLKLLEIKDRNEAELLRDKEIETSRENLLPLKENQYYVDDLCECAIFFEDGQKVGRIVEVSNYGASDILTIRDGSEEILCPFLNDVFVDVDTKNKKIIANKKRFLEVTKSED